MHHKRTRKHPELKPKAGRAKRTADPVLRVEKAIRELRYTYDAAPQSTELRSRLADALELVYISHVLEWVPDERTGWPFIVNSVARVIANEMLESAGQRTQVPNIRYLGNRYLVVDMLPYVSKDDA